MYSFSLLAIRINIIILHVIKKGVDDNDDGPFPLPV